jgi:putative oxidoreductase
MNKFIVSIVVVLIVLIYIMSAYNKITNFNNVASSLKLQLDNNILFKHIQNTMDISKIALVFGIFLLAVGSSLMLYGIYNNYYLKIGASLLILFLILATFLYHPPNNPNEINNFLKNLSLMGGLGFIVINYS